MSDVIKSVIIDAKISALKQAVREIELMIEAWENLK